MRKGFIHGNRRLIDLLNNRPGLKERAAEINKESDSSEEAQERNNSSQDDNR